MKKYLPSLNGLRAISILMVIANHFRDEHFLSNNKLLKYIGIFAFDGSLAVGIFFIISGFLITTLLIEEQEIYGIISLKNFYVRRIIRIFPAYYLFLIVCFICEQVGYFKVPSLDWVTALTFTKQFYRKGPIELSVLWSLSVEEFFYLAWPFIFIRFKHNALTVAIILMVTTAVIRGVLTNLPAYNLSKTIFTVSDALLIGCIIAIKYDEITALISKYQKIIYLFFLFLVSSVYFYNFVFTLVYDKSSIGDAPSLSLRILNALSYSLLGSIGLLTNISIGLLIVYSIVSRGKWFDFLNTSIMNHIGKLSYSIYLFYGFFTTDRPVLHQIPILILIAGIYISASISYNLVEKPFFRFRKYFSNPLKA